jgi:hypothetical protein
MGPRDLCGYNFEPYGRQELPRQLDGSQFHVTAPHDIASHINP